jgi:tRNA nucleotidyltransferase/poly(A) polymerase
MTKEKAQELVRRFPILQELRRKLQDTEFENNVYIVGGAVRDFLYGRPPKEFDFMITLPDGGVRFANHLTHLYRVHREGTNPVIFKRFGTAAFRIKGTEFEAVMSRKEIYHPFDRKPDVAYGTLEEDLSRRDFTINAIAFDLSNLAFLDPFNGYDDMQKGIIRTTSEATSIFQEDPLRILRAFRFESQLGFTIVPETLAAAREMIDGLSWLACERIQAELEKMMSSDRPALALQRLVESGAIPHVFSQLAQRGDQIADWSEEVRLLKVLKPDLAARIAAILHTLKEDDVRDALKSLRFDKKTIEAAVFLSQDLPQLISAWQQKFPADNELCRMRLTLGDGYYRTENYLDALTRGSSQKRRAVFTHVHKAMERLFPPNEDIPEFTLSGMHIIAHFHFPPGPRIGRMLRTAKEIWLDQPHLDNEELLTALETQLSSPNPPGTRKRGRRPRGRRRPKRELVENTAEMDDDIEAPAESE